ncbi:MAG TPA: delta-60 repeat domain-containing protein [Solirubrobacteraceae bacterium]|jgi:uncharacterized delta-60 repeat protein
MSVAVVVAAAVTLLMAVGSTGAAGAATSTVGQLDTSFGQGGVATLDLHRNAFGQALAVQPDGRVVVAGSAVSPSGAVQNVVVARFTASGTLDTSFNGAGVDQPDFGKSETGYGIALQSNGGILVVGDVDDQHLSQFLVTRFSGDGTLDTTFGQGGTSEIGIGSADDLFGRGLGIQANGNMVLVGYDSTQDATIEGLDSQGIAPAGGHDAILHGINSGELEGVAVTPDNEAVAVGTAGSSPSNLVVARDSTIKTISFGADSVGTSIAALPNGKVLVAGDTDVAGTYDFAVARLNSDLSLDTTFGSGGKAIVDLGGTDYANAIAVQPDGKIVLAGNTTAGGGANIGVVRLSANGAPDATFGNNGISVIKIANSSLYGTGVGLQANGDIVVGGHVKVAGSTQENLLAVRLHGDTTGKSGSGSSGSAGGTPGSGSTGGGSAPSSSGAPTLSGVSASKTTIHEANFAPKLNPTGAGKGTVISATISEAAQLTLTFTKPAPGRMAHGHCSAPNRSNRRGHHCTRHVSVATTSFQAKAGANTIAFGGRVSGAKKLPPGTYTIAITATASGATSAPSTVKITIKH